MNLLAKYIEFCHLLYKTQLIDRIESDRFVVFAWMIYKLH